MINAGNGSTVAWSSSNSNITASRGNGNFGGVNPGGFSALADANLTDVHPDCSQNPPAMCPYSSYSGNGGGTITPTVIIDSFSPNPIAQGASSSVHLTINPSAAITLAITSSGTGSATFPGGVSTTQITQTSSVTILGVAASQSGTVDLLLSANFRGVTLATAHFSVTSGACTGTYTGHFGDGLKHCSSQVHVTDTYNVTNFCSSCQFSCIPLGYDSTLTPTSCDMSTVGLPGSGNQTLQATETGNFAATDCSWHYLHIRTIVTNTQNIRIFYDGSSIGLKCTNYPGGASCP